MILLDLIGAESPMFQSYINPITGKCDSYGQELAQIEDTLLKLSGITQLNMSKGSKNPKSYIQFTYQNKVDIEDIKVV